MAAIQPNTRAPTATGFGILTSRNMTSRQVAESSHVYDKVVVAIASRDALDHGAALLRTLLRTGAESHLVIRADAAAALGAELERVRGLAAQVYAHENQAARISSGSFLTRGMIVAPCDGDAVAAIVMGLATNLVYRAADVTLKEARPLVLGVRPNALAQLPDDIVRRAAAVPGLAFVPLGDSLDATAAALVAQLGIEGALATA